MVEPSRTNRFAPTLVLALLAVIAVATPSFAAADFGGESNFGGTHVCGRRFEPGPIVDGHNRQPTLAEFAARIRELHALSEGTAPQEGQTGTCRVK
jgi:hypothetical protein